MTEGQISKPLPAGRMLAITLGALVGASVIVFGAILPAEFNLDPFGVGKMSGLSRLWAPREVAFDTSASTVPLARNMHRAFAATRSRFPYGERATRRAGTSLNTRCG